MGIAIGILSIVITKILYFIEDSFEKIPVHWMWWPALGGIAVGVIGYFSPRTLGVGYENVTDILSGSMPLKIVASLCLLKFLSWAIALGSGTSGGTLAPLLTIGGATGALLGSVIIHFFPSAGVTLPLAALVGMSAMFAGASRALLTSIIFALESTSQSNALLPLLAACAAAYFVSYFLMENTIMTEKIARRGVKTPHSYEPDILETITVEQVIEENSLVLSANIMISEVTEWLQKEPEQNSSYFIITSNEGDYRGIVSSSNIFSKHHKSDTLIGSLIKRKQISVSSDDSLKKAVETMAKENIDVLPVLSKTNNHIVGIISYKNIIAAYKLGIDDHEKKSPHISLKRRSLRVLVHGQKLLTLWKSKH
jgi:predicted transcriptional regulator